jgi:hypothetical protein
MTDIDNEVKMPSLSQLVRGIGAAIGLIMMVTGIVYAVRLFRWIYEGVKSPERITDLIRRWGDGLGGGESIELDLGELGMIPLSDLVGGLIVGLATLVLVRIALLFITEGSKVIQNALGEKEAIKNILRYTFGPGQVKRDTSTNLSPDS